MRVVSLQHSITIPLATLKPVRPQRLHPLPVSRRRPIPGLHPPCRRDLLRNLTGDEASSDQDPSLSSAWSAK